MTEAQTAQASMTTLVLSTLRERFSISTLNPKSLLSRHHGETAVSVVDCYEERSYATPPSIQTSVPEEPETDTVYLTHSRFGSCSLRLRIPLELPVRFDKKDRVYTLEYEPLEILVYSRSRSDLRHQLDRQICFLWEEYACENDSKLTPRARDLKRRVLAYFEEHELGEEQEGG